MEYYSAIKRNEIVPFLTIWMDLEGIMLSEISHTEKDKYHVISLICGILRRKNELMEYNVMKECTIKYANLKFTYIIKTQ